MRLAITGATLCGLCGVAAAEMPYYDYDEEPREMLPQRDLDLEIGVGFIAGAYGVGGVIDSADGVLLGVGWRHDRFLVLGEYEGLAVGGDDLEDGIIHRAGAGLRYDLGYFGKGIDRSVWGGSILWAEVGVGWEHFGWDGGANTDRSDLSLGLGGQYTIRFGGEKPKLVGIYYGAKLLAAKAPPPVAVARLCVEGCGADEMSSRDLGVFFTAAIVMGR